MSLLARVRDGRVGRVAGWVVTGAALVLVFGALVLPNRRDHITLTGFLRIPVEGLVIAAVLLALPLRARRITAGVVGALLGLLTILKMLDIGFFEALNRPFDPAIDWVLFDDAFNFLKDSIGKSGAIGVLIGIIVLVVAALVLMTLSAVRLAGALGRHDRPARGVVGALGIAWFIGIVFSVQVAPEVPAAALVHDRAVQVATELKDERQFARDTQVDAFRDTPGDQLLTALRGKDVIFTFIESYGRSAIDNAEFNAGVDATLTAGTDSLQAAGFGSRSGYLTSPTYGGGSWLAHSTFLSGLWVTNQRRYNKLIAGDRQTLPSAFGRAGWNTVGLEPGNTFDWPEGKFYGYDKVYDSRNMDYHGKSFSWSTMPDQFAMESFQRTEYGRPHQPLMTEITLTSSHTPWAPQPTLVDWNQVGDGSIYTQQSKDGLKPDQVWSDPHKVRAEYAKSIKYSLQTLITWIERYGDKNLVMVFLGDHQPAPIVTGYDRPQVPITIVAHDQAVLDRVDAWGWTNGLKPAADAPVWRMDSFRDKFLATFASPTKVH